MSSSIGVFHKLNLVFMKQLDGFKLAVCRSLQSIVYLTTFILCL